MAGAGWALAFNLAAAVSWLQVFPATQIAPLLASAVVLPVVATAAVMAQRNLRISRWAVLAGVFVSAVLSWGLAARGGSPIFSAPLQGLFFGWQRLLTVPLLVPAETPFTLVPVMVLGLAASITTVARGRPGWLLFTPPAIAWFTGVLMGVSGALGVLAVAGPLLAVSLVRLATTTRVPNRSQFVSMVSIGVVSLVALAVGLAVAQPISGLMRATPLDLREDVQPPVSIDNQPDPLGQLGAQLAATSTEPAFRLTSDAPQDRSPFALLTTYEIFDGSSWSMAGAAVPASSVIEQPGGLRSQVIRQHIEGSAFTRPWIPHTGQVTGVQTPGVLVFNSAGVLIDPQADTRNEYDITVTAPLDDPSAVVTVGAVEDAALLEVPCLPSQLESGMSTAAATAPGPIAKAVAIQQWLATSSGLTVSREAPAGSSCSRLEELTQPDQDHRVNSEQLATLLTLGLRQADVPARLAYGYRLGAPGPDGVYAPPAGNAAAFTQILVDPLGWVSVDAAPAEAPNVASTVTEVPAIEQQVPTDTGDGTGDGPGPIAAPKSTSVPWQAVVVVATVALGLLVLVGWLLWASVKRRADRKRARSLQDPRDQQLAAWTEVLAGLVRAGVPVSSSTFAQTVAKCEDLDGVAAPVAELAGWAERALYDPRESAGALSANAFELSDQAVAALRVRRSRRQRLADLFDPRSAAQILEAAPVPPATPLPNAPKDVLVGSKSR